MMLVELPTQLTAATKSQKMDRKFLSIMMELKRHLQKLLLFQQKILKNLT